MVTCVDTSAEKLIQDVRGIVRDAEHLIKATAGEVGETTREARAKLAGALVVVRESCNRFERSVLEQAGAAGRVIREKPYESTLVAFALGLLIGCFAVRVRRMR